MRAISATSVLLTMKNAEDRWLRSRTPAGSSPTNCRTCVLQPFRRSEVQPLRKNRTGMTEASVAPVSELCRRRNDLLSQPLDVTLYRVGVARDRADHHLMNPRVAVPFHLV